MLLLGAIFLFTLFISAYGETAPVEPKFIEVRGTLPGYPDRSISDFKGFKREYCISCHEGIEEISSSHPREWGCTICHNGDPTTLDKDTAHETLLYSKNSSRGKRNPSDLRVVEQSCGQKLCHAGHDDERMNHIERVKTSLMAQQTGIISTIQYLFGNSLFIKSMDDYLSRPEQSASHFADSKWENLCNGCHLWDEGISAPGRYRASGCAACHMLYNDDGFYTGGDRTLPKNKPGYSKTHKLTLLVPKEQCNICHKNSWTSLSGLTYEGVAGEMKDIHAEKGLECIDCHTLADTMGNGNFYAKGKDQVEIGCDSCHGNYQQPVISARIESLDDPVIKSAARYGSYKNRTGDRMVVTKKGNKFTNIKKEGQQVVLYSKFTGKRHIIPQITYDQQYHALPAHTKKLECTVCHAQWVPQYYGGTDTLVQNRKSSDRWTKAFKFAKFKTPALGINADDKVALFLPLFQMEFTAKDSRGHKLTAVDTNERFAGVYDRFTFSTLRGYSAALASSPAYPHSTGKFVRKCPACHLSSQTLGLGEGSFLSKKRKGKNKFLPLHDALRDNGSSVFPYDALITIQGEQIGATGFDGARGLNRNEISRILKVGVCISCHDRYNDPIYKDMPTSYRKANTQTHKTIIREYLH